VTRVTDTIELLKTGKVEELSLDHDLGTVDEAGRESTGYDVLLWIEEQVALHGLVPPVLHVHSANPPRTSGCSGRSRRSISDSARAATKATEA
jgi:Cyclic-phosphate processing Receiver domain